MANESAFDAVRILDEIIRNPNSRQLFHEDPRATLLNAGGNVDDVPPEVWRALTEMTLAELDAIAALGAALAEAGLLDGSHRWSHVV